MSPALLNKYLQAAREVADHMVLTPDGFDFAPYPMLVETDREKFAIQRIVDFYDGSPPTMRTTSRPPGASSIARRWESPRDPGQHRGGGEGEPEVSADGLADS